MQKDILIVDDESSLRRTLSISLQQRGFSTVLCENGINALKTLDLHVKNGFPPDIMVVDIKLPDIDGIKLIKIVKFQYPNIPIIIITGYKELYSGEDIENLNVRGFLEKPFSADALALQFDEILRERDTVPSPLTSESEKVSPVVSAYLLLKLNENCNFFETYRKLYFMENVVYCDALQGDFDICMLLHTGSIEELKKFYKDKIMGSKEIKEADFLEIRKPILEENTNTIIKNAEEALAEDNQIFGKGRNMSVCVCSYVFIEVEKEKLDKIYPSLRLNDNVVYCDYTDGKYDLILFIQGNDFEQIDRIIENKIIGLDGILKVKECPILNFFDM
ncbi:response regulator [Candidatus Latescibacterota bacterium]